MASTTIHTLSYKMVADTQNFTRGLISSRSEIAALKKIMGDTSPEQKAEQAIGRINKLYDAGKISAEQHARSLKLVQRELHAVQRSASIAHAAMGKMQDLMIRGAKIGAGAAAAGITVLGFNVKKEIGAIKDLADAAEDLKIPFNDLVRIQQAFVRGGEVGGDVAIPALRTMSQNIQLASRDMGKFKALAGELSLDMDTMFALSKMPMLKQFETVVQQISAMPDQGGKGLIVQKLFGVNENKLTTLLGGGLDQLREVGRTADKFGMTLKDDSVEAVRQLVSQTEQLEDRWTGLIRRLATELTPWLDKLVKTIETINRWIGDDSRGLMKPPMAITGPGGVGVPADPKLMEIANTDAEFMMLRNLTNIGKRLDPNFDVRTAMKANPTGRSESALISTGFRNLTSEAWRSGNAAKDEEVMKVLIDQLITSLRRNAEAQEQSNEQRQKEQSRME